MIRATMISAVALAAVQGSALGQMSVINTEETNYEVLLRLMSPEEFQRELSLSNTPAISPQPLRSAIKPMVDISSNVADVEIVNTFPLNGKNAFVVSLRNPNTGELALVSKDQLIVADPSGRPLSFSMNTVEQARAPIAMLILLDVSGSMGGYEAQLAEAAEKLFDALPGHAQCQVITFGSEVRAYGSLDSACSSNNISQLTFTASGGTPAFRALETAFATLQGKDHHQKVVVMMTDGGPTDTPDQAALVKAKGSAKVVLYWLGNKAESAEQVFAFVADHVITDPKDPIGAVTSYLDVISDAFANQAVVTIDGLLTSKP